MTIFEEPHIAQILAAWKPILYAGVMSCGMGYTLQIVGQKGVNPASASLILSLESSISVLAGWLILGQKLTGRQILGCVLMFRSIFEPASHVGQQEKFLKGYPYIFRSDGRTGP